MGCVRVLSMIEKADVFIISLAVLWIVLIRITVFEKSRRNMSQNLFYWMVVFTMATTIIELVVRVFAYNNSGLELIKNGIQIIPILLWTLYADYQIYKNNQRLTFFKKILVYWGIAYGSYVVISAVFDFNMSIGITLFTYIPFAFTLFSILWGKKYLLYHEFYPLLFFALPPLMAVGLEWYNPNVLIGWPSVSISILVLYVSIQSQQANTDYLTGLFNRRYLDVYLGEKLKNTWSTQCLGLMMIDLDRFKEINDFYGHVEGDKALEITAKLIKQTVGDQDFVARYAGDEFVIVVETQTADSSQAFVEIEALIQSLQNAFVHYNQHTLRKWSLEYSLGCIVVESEKLNTMTVDKLLKAVDQKMYQEKIQKVIA